MHEDAAVTNRRRANGCSYCHFLAKGGPDKDTSLFRLNGLAAIVTGFGRGIGLAIADMLLRQHARVLVNGHDSTETDNAVT